MNAHKSILYVIWESLTGLHILKKEIHGLLISFDLSQVFAEYDEVESVEKGVSEDPLELRIQILLIEVLVLLLGNINELVIVLHQASNRFSHTLDFYVHWVHIIKVKIWILIPVVFFVTGHNLWRALLVVNAIPIVAWVSHRCRFLTKHSENTPPGLLCLPIFSFFLFEVLIGFDFVKS